MFNSAPQSQDCQCDWPLCRETFGCLSGLVTLRCYSRDGPSEERRMALRQPFVEPRYKKIGRGSNPSAEIQWDMRLI